MRTVELTTSYDESGMPGLKESVGMGRAVLVHNANWFMRLRWLVISVFLVVGFVSLFFPGFFGKLHIATPSYLPWLLAGVLVAANILFYFRSKRMDEERPIREVKTNLWLQIVVDLVVLTVLVHAMGSTNTYVSFAYLFHIALACIFFPPRHSLLVTLMAIFLYLACTILETFRILPSPGIMEPGLAVHFQNPVVKFVYALTAVFIWIIMWYLISSLSGKIRERELQLSLANEQLVRADREKTIQVLKTTHELKAPFCGIECNIQVLQSQYWDEIPDSIKEVIKRIKKRSKTLRERIREILILGELKSKKDIDDTLTSVSLRSVFDAVLENIEQEAKQKNISLDVNVREEEVRGDKKQYSILFSNLVANSIQYSPEGEIVRIDTKKYGSDEVSVIVEDHGIGIDEELLPHIFEEYFRTKEGAKYNPMSTGLGLSIVKEIALKLRLKIRVRSELGSGTIVEVVLPRP